MGSHGTRSDWFSAHMEVLPDAVGTRAVSPGAREGRPQPGLSQALRNDSALGQLCLCFLLRALHLVQVSSGTTPFSPPSLGKFCSLCLGTRKLACWWEQGLPRCRREPGQPRIYWEGGKRGR